MLNACPVKTFSTVAVLHFRCAYGDSQLQYVVNARKTLRMSHAGHDVKSSVNVGSADIIRYKSALFLGTISASLYPPPTNQKPQQPARCATSSLSEVSR